MSPKLLINLHQARNPSPVKDFCINGKSSQNHRLLRLSRIIINYVMTARHLVEGSAYMEDLHRIVVHFVQHAA